MDKLWKELESIKSSLASLLSHANSRNRKIILTALADIEATKLDGLAVALEGLGNAAEARQARARATVIHARFDAETKDVQP